MRRCLELFFCLLPAVGSVVLGFSRWLSPFDDANRIYQLCNDRMDSIVLPHGHPMVDFYLEKYVLCYADFEKFVPVAYQPLVWFMRSLRFCEVNQIFQHDKHRSYYERDFQKKFFRFSYILICDRAAQLSQLEQYELMQYSSLFSMLHERDNPDRQYICDTVSSVYSDLYSRCYVPHVAKRLMKIQQRWSSSMAPLLKFDLLFQRFSRKCDSFHEFVRKTPKALRSMGVALANDTVYMNLLSSNLVVNIHSDSELPSLVLKTRLLLQHFSLAAVKLWRQIAAYRSCEAKVQSESNVTGSDAERTERLHILVTNTCCGGIAQICELQNEKQFRNLSDNAWIGFKIEVVLIGFVIAHTLLLGLLLLKTRRALSTATVLFVFNILFSNMLFLLSFVFLFEDLLNEDNYGPVNEDHVDKPPELVVAETLQTHLFAAAEFRKHLVQETLYSLAQNGSLTGLIMLLVLVLVVMNRSMAGGTVKISRLAVISLFAAVWTFLVVSHIAFSTMQINAIQNLDELFATLAKGRQFLQCGIKVISGYEEIASHCDRTAVFHAFGAYLLRGHTLFTLLFLIASIIIFTCAVGHHIKVRKEYEMASDGVRHQLPHKRRERLFHTLVLSIATFFLSILGQTYIEIAVFTVEERAGVAYLTKWYHVARIAAFLDPLLNPLVVVARTPPLRRQFRTQWSTLRSRASSRREGGSGGGIDATPSRSASMRERRDVELRFLNSERVSARLSRSNSHRRSAESQLHNSIV